MSIPIHLQQFKAAGIYRVVFDKSTIVNYDTELLRLVVGYSEQGPFNTPVYVKDPQTFVAMFGGINKKLEKRGIFFHRLALQMLQVSPCLVLNLKKFKNETVGGATISSDFNPTANPIDTVELNVEDIYDTTRFWTLEADKLNNLRDIHGKVMEDYINIATTNTKKTSATVFIRKASGIKVQGYNITVNDWYSDDPAGVPEFLEKFKNNLISDFFAEVYVFKGKFTAKQVLASDTLKNYFVVELVNEEEDENGEKVQTFELKLRDKVYDAFGDAKDTLDMLYADETSNALGHYVGCLIPEFKNKNNGYAALDILFNTDIDVHNMMMSFNTDMLYEDDGANLDLSGRLRIPTYAALKEKKVPNDSLSIDKIFDGTATTSVLGNVNAPVVADIMSLRSSVVKKEVDEAGNVTFKPLLEFYHGSRSIGGTMVVTSVTDTTITLQQCGTHEEVVINYESGAKKIAAEKFGVVFKNTELTLPEPTYYTQEECNEHNATLEGAVHAGDVQTPADDEHPEDVLYTDETAAEYNATLEGAWTTETVKEGIPNGFFEIKNGFGTGWTDGNAFEDVTPNNKEQNLLSGPEKVITSVTAIEKTDDASTYTDIDDNLKVSLLEVSYTTDSKYTNKTIKDGDSVYGTSVTFIDYDDDNWSWSSDVEIIDGVKEAALICTNYYDRSLLSILTPGDCLLAQDNVVDYNENDEHDDADNYCDAVYVQELGSKYDANGNFVCHYVKLNGKPMIWPADDSNNERPITPGYEGPDNINQYIIRIDAPLNQEIGTMKPLYLEGYTYQLSRPDGTGMYAKLQWQKEILSVLTDYKGLRTGLLNKSEIDYRYVIDTFASFPDSSIKKELAYLCKQKQSAFCIANFPSVQSFTKCPYASFTDSKGIFNVEYVVKGCNKKKASSISFSMPDDTEGASFIAFYTPLKFSDGYLDTIVPSAGLVSNLFIEKYMTRQPYYIVAGPNYGRVNASGMIGPDYKYSMDELQVIEPFGVNCMVYRPNFGTFINANQTAKQVPLSALSKVHVRELVIYLMDEVEKVLQAYQWEFNNSRTREAILSRANDICARIMSNGGLQAYLNIMDKSNNTPEIIDNEMAVLSTHIEPGMGCGKMVHELTLYRTGQMMSSIAEA